MLFDVGLNSIINDRLIAALIVLIGIEINWHRRLCIKNYSEGSKTNLGGLGTTCSPCQTMVRWYVSLAERLYNDQYHTQNQQALLWKVDRDYSEHWIWTPYIWSTAMDRCSPSLFGVTKDFQKKNCNKFAHSQSQNRQFHKAARFMITNLYRTTNPRELHISVSQCRYLIIGQTEATPSSYL